MNFVVTTSICQLYRYPCCDVSPITDFLNHSYQVVIIHGTRSGHITRKRQKK